MASETVSATTIIDAPAEAVFAVLADPSSHAAIDGTGWVREPLDSQPLTAAGQVFRMAMYHANHPAGNYQMANRVQVLDPPRAISWEPGQDTGDGSLRFGGWVWRSDSPRSLRTIWATRWPTWPAWSPPDPGTSAGNARGRVVLVARVRCGLPQGERDDQRQRALNGRRQPLDHAHVTADVSCCHQQPARQPGEEHGHRRAAVDTEDPRSRRPAPGDKHGPDRCRDDAAHREDEVAQRRARGRFRSGRDADSRKASQDQQDARRQANGSETGTGRALAAAHQQQRRGHDPPVGSRLTSQHADRLAHRAVRGRLKRAGHQPAPDQDHRYQQGSAYRPARDWPASPQQPRAIRWHWLSGGRSRAGAQLISS
jgi:hypothetical protein